MKKFISLIKTFISLLNIYFLFNFSKKKLKIVMFYFPVKIYQENLLEIIKKLDKKNCTVLLAYNSSSIFEIKNQKNSFFLDFNFIKFIPFKNFFLKNIKIFLSSYLVYVFPPKSKNIYISHDIYDAPMINKSLEKKMFLGINKLDYIFTSSEISSEYFISKFNKYKIKSNTKLINTGYSKLDHVAKKINNKNNNKKDSILIAPGFTYTLKKFNMSRYLEKNINLLLKETNDKIVYRPHPLDSSAKGDIFFVNKISSKFKDNPRFFIDLSVSYLDSYKRAKFMITDLSSTAYTFAFSTERPVIFFSKNEPNLKKDLLSNSHYFDDRNKIGKIINNHKQLSKELGLIHSKMNKYKNQIKELRKKRIKHFGKASEVTVKKIEYILKT